MPSLTAVVTTDAVNDDPIGDVARCDKFSLKLWENWLRPVRPECTTTSECLPTTLASNPDSGSRDDAQNSTFA